MARKKKVVDDIGNIKLINEKLNEIERARQAKEAAMLAKQVAKLNVMKPVEIAAVEEVALGADEDVNFVKGLENFTDRLPVYILIKDMTDSEKYRSLVLKLRGEEMANKVVTLSVESKEVYDTVECLKTCLFLDRINLAPGVRDFVLASPGEFYGDLIVILQGGPMTIREVLDTHGGIASSNLLKTIKDVVAPEKPSLIKRFRNWLKSCL